MLIGLISFKILLTSLILLFKCGTISWGDCMTTATKNKQWIKTAVLSAVLSFSILAFLSALWYKNLYGDVGFDAILFTLFSDLHGADNSILLRYFFGAFVPTILLSVGLNFLLFFNFKKEINLKGKKLFPFSKPIARIISLVLSFSLLISATFLVSLPQWAVAKMRCTTLYEEHFVSPKSTQITFPQNKRNLIYIFLESTETTYFSKEEGGGMDKNLMPNLYSLAKENLNFSHLNNEVGGAETPTASTWTVAAMVSQTAGIPLKLPVGIGDNSYGEYSAFLPGAVSINDILHENGYNQALMVGSDADFGGRYGYFSQHGVDKIYDIYTAYDDGIVPKDYWVWWGMEDKYLFEYAKQELTKMSEQPEPFAFTMLTVDTHFVNGYKCDLCKDEYEEPYENVISCADRQVYEFVEWIKTQPFYENTTIVISGDHLTMDEGYINRTAGEECERRIYNCFLNSVTEPENAYNRNFTSFDMFPTTLASLGVKIEGERLGLGTNLFSNKQTLTEQLGYDYVSDELKEMSNYYNDKILNAYK